MQSAQRDDVTQSPGRMSRYVVTAELAAARFGVDVEKLPRAGVEQLLRALPAAIDERTPGVLDRIAAACSIGETHFLRHPEQLAAVTRLAADLPAAREARPVRVWSAGCATGEEAYSLAATLSVAAPFGVEIVGTDLNAESIHAARAGVYRAWSLRGLSPASVSEWLEGDGRTITVRDHVRRLVEFRVQNLMDRELPGGFDVVFCRNVLLYFTGDAARRVLAALAESVRPGGVLVLGDFDPRPAADVWHEEREGAVTWFRRAVAVPPADFDVVPPPRVVPILAPVTATPDDAEPGIDARLADARALAQRGEHAEAGRLLEVIRAASPLACEPHALAAIIAGELGDAERKLAAARSLLLLAPNEPMAHYLFAVALERVGQHQRAVHHLVMARAALSQIDDLSRLLRCGEGLTGFQLRRLIDVRIGRDDR